MNRVITINLNGNSYQLEESGYDALRAYLDNAERRLKDNPDKDEIIADIEQAIADKFRALLGANKNVVITREVESALEAMGPVQDAGTSDDQASAGAGAGSQPRTADQSSDAPGTRAGDESSGPVKRLFVIQEGAMLAGVCNGLAAYFNLDVTIIRLLFVILTFFWGTGALVYLLMAFIVPTACTPAERAAASGGAATAQEFIRRAKAGYYEGMKAFQGKHARREWKRKFKQQMRGWQQGSHHYRHGHNYHWKPQWAPQSPYPCGPGFVLPLFWLVNALITVVGLYAIFSLVKTGAVFGLALPAGVPLWIGIVALIVLWNVLAWPVKVLHWGASCDLGHRPRLHGPFGAFGDFLVGLCFLVLVVWLADRYLPQVHEALKQLPPLLQQALDSVQRWLDRH